MAMKQFSFRVEEDIANRFIEKCKADEIPQSDVLRALLEIYSSGEIQFERKLVYSIKQK